MAAVQPAIDVVGAGVTFVILAVVTAALSPLLVLEWVYGLRWRNERRERLKRKEEVKKEVSLEKRPGKEKEAVAP